MIYEILASDRPGRSAPAKSDTAMSFKRATKIAPPDDSGNWRWIKGQWIAAAPKPDAPRVGDPVDPDTPVLDYGPDRLHRGSYATELLTADQNDAWIALVDDAEQTPPADRTDTQKAVLRAWRHFTLHEYIKRENVHTKAGAMALYIWGVLGPVYDEQSGIPPTPEEQAAIDAADRLSRFLPPSP